MQATGCQPDSTCAFMLSSFKNDCVIESGADFRGFGKTKVCFSQPVNGCRSRPRSRSMTSAILGRHPRQINDQMPTSQRIWASPNPMVAMHPSSLQNLDRPYDISGCPIQSLLSSEVLSVLPTSAAGLQMLPSRCACCHVVLMSNSWCILNATLVNALGWSPAEFQTFL